MPAALDRGSSGRGSPYRTASAAAPAERTAMERAL